MFGFILLQRSLFVVVERYGIDPTVHVAWVPSWPRRVTRCAFERGGGPDEGPDEGTSPTTQVIVRRERREVEMKCLLICITCNQVWVLSNNEST